MPSKTGLIVGASHGLGAATANELAAHAWEVIGTSRSEPEKVTSPKISWVRHDVSSVDPTPIVQAIEGRALDALVVTAMRGGPKGSIALVDPTDLAASFEVAVAGVARVVRACLPALLTAPAPTIAIVSSRLGSISAQARGDFSDFDTSYAYRISKAAQNMFVASLGQEFAGRIRCLAVHPGTLSTTMGRQGANKTAALAASQLRKELESDSPESPRFVSLGSPDLAW